MSDNLEVVTKIEHRDAKGNRTLIAFVMGQPNMLVGDLYNLRLHKTDFNAEQECDIPAGTYVVVERVWGHHLASVWRPQLVITIEDIPKPKKR